MARSKFPSDDVDRTMLRMPAGMRDRIASAAKANGRSMNAEIVARLEASLSVASDGLSNDVLAKIQKEAERAVAETLGKFLHDIRNEGTR